MVSAEGGSDPVPGPLEARLSASQIDLLRPYAAERATVRGEVLFREGDRSYDFLVILAGTVAAIDGYGAAERELGVGYPGDFAAELNLFTGERLYTTAVVREPGAVLAVPVSDLREQIATHPGLGDVIMPALLARRQWLAQHQAGFQIIGSRYSPDTGRLREFATRNRLPHSFVDLDHDRAGARLLEDHGLTPAQSPAVLMRGGELLLNPSGAELAAAVGLTAAPDPGAVYDLLVVGAGPAGLAASVYASSEGLRVATMDAAGTGGQIGTTSRIENYLGFPAGVSGAEFATRAVLQAQRFGTELIVPGAAVAHHEQAGFHVVRLHTGQEVAGRSVIIATGMQYRRLEVPDIERFESTSVFYTPVAAAEELGAGDPVIVVGDGNSAGQAATFLASEGHQVTVVILGNDLSHTMASYLIDRIDHDPDIEVLPYSQVAELDGDVSLQGAVIEDRRSGLRRRVEARAMFVLIGAEPHTGWLAGSARLDEAGFILTGDALGADIRDTEPWHALGRGPYPLETSVPGMFAAGDVRADSVRRVGSAVGDGSLAAQLVHEWLGSSGASHIARWYGARTKRRHEIRTLRAAARPRTRDVKIMTMTPQTEPVVTTPGAARLRAEPLRLDRLIRARVIHSMTGGTYRSVGLRGAEIVAVSDEPDGLDELAGTGTVMVDAGDLTVLPAFADSHEHLKEASRNTLLVPVERARSVAEFTGMVADAARAAGPGAWVLTSMAWHESNLAENRLPTGAELDAAAPDNPVLAQRGGHLAIANTAALTAAGVGPGTPDPPGGKFGRLPDGRLNGVLESGAVWKVAALAPAPARAQLVEGLGRGSAAYAALGVGTIREAMIDLEEFLAYQDAAEQGKLSVRVRPLIRVGNELTAEAAIAMVDGLGARSGFGDDWLRLWGLKFVMDGGVEGGALEQPYANDPHDSGHLNWDPDVMTKVCAHAVRRGWRIGTHAAGDRALRTVLDVYEAVAAQAGPLPPWTLVIEHALLSDTAQRQRAVRGGFAVTVQHSLLWNMGSEMLRTWGPERTSQVNPLDEWLALGASLAAGTDIARPFNPMTNVWGMVTRGTKSAGIQGPEHAIDVATALQLYTMGTAALNHEQDRLGSITPGKLADLVAYPIDPLAADPDDLAELTPAFTLVGGRAVHDPDGVLAV